MLSAPCVDIVVGAWVARFEPPNEDRPELAVVRDVYDGNLNLEMYSSDGRPLGRKLVLMSGPRPASQWEPIEPPDFQQLAAVFSYGKFIRRRRLVRGSAPLNLLRQARLARPS